MQGVISAAIALDGSGSVDATASSWAADNPLIDVAKRLVGDVKQAPQIIALALVFLRGHDFGVIIWRINQARYPLEVLLARVL
jgi:predicted signal transduction protein with EAL and GGDEF domain